MVNNKIILIAGLTASGKSQLALDIASALQKQHSGGSAVNGGVIHGSKQEAIIINADSMQVYCGLSILTARPQASDLLQAPHYLYGFIEPSCRFSVGAWLQAVEELLQQPEVIGKTLIFVGGTGLYFRALLHGLAETPPISATVRQQGQEILAERGLNALYADLQCFDPQTAAKLQPQDKQRILRAWEVWQQTGKSLKYWQEQEPPQGKFSVLRKIFKTADVRKFVLLPPRDMIYERINARVDKMLREDVLEEVKALHARKLDSQLPIMKASGLREFYVYLDETMALSAAIEKAKQETRRYAKRQRTWFGRQLGSEWRVLANSAEFWHSD